MNKNLRVYLSDTGSEALLKLIEGTDMSVTQMVHKLIYSALDAKEVNNEKEPAN